MQLGIDQWFAFGIGVGVESLRATLTYYSLTEAKGSTDIFDNSLITIKLLMSELQIAPFDSDSDSDPDRDDIALR